LKKYLFLIACCLPFLLSNCKAKQAAISNERNTDKALLWEIKGKDLKAPSYVFGTIHMIPAQDFFLPNGTLTAIEKTKEMVFEIDMADMSDMSNIMGLMSKLFMKDNTSLKDLLTAEEYKKVSAHFKSIGLPMMMLDRIKPMILSAFTMGDIKPTDMANGKIKSYEIEFYDVAKNKKMKTGGLETIDFQIAIFDSIPYKDQAKMLINQLNGGDTSNDDFKKLTEIYKAQDIEKLYTETMASDELDKNSDILLVKRNQAWIPIMAAQSKKTPTFYAVGAGHLAGPNGVITLLKKAGYSVTAVK
jgi:uncharacterized protein